MTPFTPFTAKPTPELYRSAADIAGTCGWTNGFLAGACSPKTNERVPCCVNGHLMIAGGVEPNYVNYDVPAYEAVAAEVVTTLRARPDLAFGANFGDLLSFKPSSAGIIQDWNDENLKNAVRTRAFDYFGADRIDYAKAAEYEREVLVATAERLELQAEDAVAEAELSAT
jgi:hypothetical protein